MATITKEELREQNTRDTARMRELLSSTDPAAVGEWKTLQMKVSGRDRLIVSEPGDMPGLGLGHEETPAMNATRALIKTPEYRAGFRTYLKAGTMEARAALSVSADGVLIPQGFQDQLEIIRKAYSRMRDNCTIIVTDSGNSLPFPIMDDTANAGSWLSEAAAMNATSPTFANIVLGAALLSSDQVLVSVQALQDFAFSAEAFLTEAFGVRLGRGTNKAYTIGDGSGTYGGITGLLPALIAAGGRSVRLVGANANSGNAGDTALNSLGTDDFSNLIAALDPAYRDGASFMANAATFDHCRTLKDKYGRPIWDVSLAAGDPKMIFGYPFFANQDMPLLGAGNNPIIFGNFKKYLVRDVLGITAVRFNELYMANHQVGFAAFLRTWGQLLTPKAFVYGNTSAS